MRPQSKLREVGDELVPELKDVQSKLMMAGAAGAVVCAIGLFMNPAQFVRSFLPAYMWVLAITLGSLGLAMVHQVSGGAWGVVIRRILGAATRTLPLLTILFIPIALGLRSLYPWADAAHVAERSHPAVEAALPERAVFPRAGGDLLRVVERSGVLLEQVVGGTGRHRRSNRAAEDAEAQRRRPARVRLDDHLRGLRLADVARAALVLDDLWRAHHGRTGALGDGIRDRRARVARSPGTLQRAHHDEPLPRSRQPDDGVHDVVDLFRLLAVPHHLGGEHSGRDRVVSAPHRAGVAIHRARRSSSFISRCRFSCCCTAQSSGTPRWCRK